MCRRYLILTLSFVFLPSLTPALTQVRFWLTLDSSAGQKKIHIHTSGFSSAKTFGFELSVDTAQLPPTVIKNATIRFMSFEDENTFVLRTSNSIRFFAFSRGNNPLLSCEGGEVITITFPSNTTSINVNCFKFTKWNTLLINEFFEPVFSIASPSDKSAEPSSSNSVSRFLVFPNPIKDHFLVRNDAGDLRECKITLYDVLGRTVLKRKILSPFLSGSDELINTKRLAQGAYFLRIQFTNPDGRKKTETKKLLIIK
jgi:hypothetical protein